ncbi:filamentous hemagglutinin N-terminal domain-containing protein [Nostoc sp.]|uniref:filamentous hemagglutinin N-terminal domain-containing protein n=1 Tax=Nostoc sp. TaxID=1180 RepID=UPI002FFC8D11
MSFRTARLDWLQGLGIAIVSAIALYANISVAQITPDGTLPNNSNVRLEGNTFNITGGSQAGSNLFHSFKDFSVTTGSTAFFNNAANIQNIISRVTGKSISNIDGLIKANGPANLFLINPNGIIFGENARLDIGGSFFATSANSMKFADGFEFSAKNPQSAPLLTISVPVGLQFGANSSFIKVQGNRQGKRDFDSPIIDTQDALRVQPGQTLALVGGDISLTGATLKTAGGRIELGSVAGNGLVSLTATNKGFALGYDGVQNFGNIQLSQQAIADASGEGSGDINIKTGILSVSGDSRLYATTNGQGSAGSIKINASNAVSFEGGGSL